MSKSVIGIDLVAIVIDSNVNLLLLQINTAVTRQNGHYLLTFGPVWFLSCALPFWLATTLSLCFSLGLGLRLLIWPRFTRGLASLWTQNNDILLGLILRILMTKIASFSFLRRTLNKELAQSVLLLPSSHLTDGFAQLLDLLQLVDSCLSFLLFDFCQW